MNILNSFKRYRRLIKLVVDKNVEIEQLKRELRMEKRLVVNLDNNYKRYKQEEINELNKEIEQNKQDYIKLSETYQNLIEKYINLQKARII